MKKLEEYCAFLVKQALEIEKSGELEEAVSKYIRAVDILLVLAQDASSHTSWVSYTDRAQSYQKKAKNLIALASVQAERQEARGPTRPIAQTAANPQIRKVEPPHSAPQIK